MAGFNAFLLYFRILCVAVQLEIGGELGELFTVEFIFLTALVVFQTVTMILRLPVVLQNRADRSRNNASCTWTFTDEGFSSDFSDRNGATHTDFNYGSLKYAAEHDKYFRLQFSREKAFIMKSDLAEGTAADLRVLLRGKLGDKFRVRNDGAIRAVMGAVIATVIVGILLVPTKVERRLVSYHSALYRVTKRNTDGIYNVSSVRLLWFEVYDNALVPDWEPHSI